jgi:hypothetical protein
LRYFGFDASLKMNRIGAVMVTVLASSAVDRGLVFVSSLLARSIEEKEQRLFG